MKKSILSLFVIITIAYSGDLSRSSEGIVTDSSTLLQWSDDVSSVDLNWSDAIDYCEALSLGGEDDWRLPNINELLSIDDLSKYSPAIKENVFINISTSSYWSSSSHASSTNYAWAVYFDNGGTIYDAKDNSYLVRCVRTGQ